MKKIYKQFLFSALSLTALLFVSCDKDEEIKVSESKVVSPKPNDKLPPSNAKCNYRPTLRSLLALASYAPRIASHL